MRHLRMAMAVGCVLAGSAGAAKAQFSNAPPAGANLLPSTLPGEVVSKPYAIMPVGKTIPKATTPAGMKIPNPLKKPGDGEYGVNPYEGTGIDTSAIVAPTTGYTAAGSSPNLLQRVGQKLGLVTDFYQPSQPTRTTWTPGLARRNRERARERMFRLD